MKSLVSIIISIADALGIKKGTQITELKCRKIVEMIYDNYHYNYWCELCKKAEYHDENNGEFVGRILRRGI